MKYTHLYLSEEILDAPPKATDINYTTREEQRDLPPLDLKKPV